MIKLNIRWTPTYKKEEWMNDEQIEKYVNKQINPNKTKKKKH